MARASTIQWLPFEEDVKELNERMERLRAFGEESGLDVGGHVEQLGRAKEDRTREVFASLRPCDRVLVARHPQRPVASTYISLLFEDFVELCGDRRFGEDKAVVCGLGKLNGDRVMVIGQRKGRTTKDRIACNFGMPHPEGFRKALLKMQMAEKFKLPVVTFMDTAGAFPGIGAEERGIAQSIAENLYAMANLRTPIVCVIIGEGASGGALGIGQGDRVLMLENSYYSVITPEGCAAILWRSREHWEDAAAAFKLVPEELIKFGIIDEIVKEPLGGAHRDTEGAARALGEAIRRNVAEMKKVPMKRLLEQRYQKYRNIGVYLEGGELRGIGAGI
ncbi:MAG: acetyl-CoA carboxylase carboxyltransferase subunit alpha [Planctomycetota bacterium]